MKYTFRCPQCEEVRMVQLSIAEYQKYKAVCEKCGKEMKRVYEVPMVKGGSNQGDLSVDSSVGGDSSSGSCSCSGGCGGCSGCGH